MTPVHLTIDVGNTTIALGLFAGEQRVADWRLPARTQTTPDELGLMLDQLLKFQFRPNFWMGEESFRESASEQAASPASAKSDWPEKAIISSVVPSLTNVMTAAVDKYICQKIEIITYQSDFGLVIDYETPTTLGIDRLVNAYAAAELYGGACLIVDLGTATKLDLVTADRHYRGGVILAGIGMMREALVNRTAQLFVTDLTPPSTVIGTSTKTCLQSGLTYGIAAQIDGLVDMIAREWPFNTIRDKPEALKVIACGGYAAMISPLSRTIEHVEPLLTLRGLARFAMKPDRRV